MIFLGTTGSSQEFRRPWEWVAEEKHMPALLLWAVPAVILIGGTGYYLLRVVHKSIQTL